MVLNLRFGAAYGGSYFEERGRESWTRVACKKCGSEDVQGSAGITEFNPVSSSWWCSDLGTAEDDYCNNCGSHDITDAAPFDPDAFEAWRRITCGEDHCTDKPKNAEECRKLIAEGHIQIMRDAKWENHNP